MPFADSQKPRARTAPSRRWSGLVQYLVFTGRLAAWISLGFLSARAALAAPLPIQASNVPFASLATVQSFTVDLGTLPARPWLRVLAVPDPTHPDMRLSIEATEWQDMPTAPGNCPGFANSFVSTSGPGVAALDVSLNGCDPRAGAFVGRTVQIKLRVLDFGPTGGPASASIQIRGETRPPTGIVTQGVTPPFVQQRLTLAASKDTVLYEDVPNASNGAGEFLWAGARAILLNAAPRRSLIAFDVESAIPASAVVDDVVLTLQVTGIAGSNLPLALLRVRPSAGTGWAEGNANAGGSELDGVPSATAAADWVYRSRPTTRWGAPGGDVVEPPLDAISVTRTGPVRFASSDLTSAVQEMVSTDGGADGFLLAGFEDPFSSQGVQLASRSHPTSSSRPALDVAFTPTEVFESGSVATQVVSFISEGQNFRWIYDLDQDGDVVTPIDGICEVTDTSSPQTLPYTYLYAGSPGFTGVDCCTWRIDAASGVVGSGQALFFHNLDVSDPANLPPDFDQDGIRNLCDNCIHVANGPLRGSCLGGPRPGAPCHSNGECGSGGVCSLSQEDSNGDSIGNACVPEPSPLVALLAGVGWTVGLTRRRARRS